jgi:hypothetical protein
MNQIDLAAVDQFPPLLAIIITSTLPYFFIVLNVVDVIKIISMHEVLGIEYLNELLNYSYSPLPLMYLLATHIVGMIVNGRLLFCIVLYYFIFSILLFSQ